jgi:hypothetical protein
MSVAVFGSNEELKVGDKSPPRWVRLPLACAAAMFVSFAPAAAQQVDLASGSVVQAVTHLKAGQYVWGPEVAPEGPTLLIVNVATQRAVLFRNGVPIGATTVSTGRPGHATPTGVFTILQKQVEHYSSIYDSAPMPYMQRLTWQGVALHAGNLPGYPASHGCIRLPSGFAKLLYGQTKVGMTVVITRQQTLPRVAPTPTIVAQTDNSRATQGDMVWDPTKQPQGPVSIVVSIADQRALVLRNGVIIGSATVTVDGPVTGTWAYALRNIDARGQHWVRLTLSAKPTAAVEVADTEWLRFRAADAFKRAVASVIEPGTTIVVTSDSVGSDDPQQLTILEAPRQQ